MGGDRPQIPGRGRELVSNIRVRNVRGEGMESTSDSREEIGFRFLGEGWSKSVIPGRDRESA